MTWGFHDSGDLQECFPKNSWTLEISPFFSFSNLLISILLPS